MMHHKNGFQVKTQLTAGYTSYELSRMSNICWGLPADGTRFPAGSIGWVRRGQCNTANPSTGAPTERCWNEARNVSQICRTD